MSRLLSIFFRSPSNWSPALALTTLAVFALVLRHPTVADIAVYVFIWSGIALAWNITAGFAGRLSLGHAAYFGIGAYCAAILYETYHVSPWVGLVVGAIMAAGMAAIVEITTVRLMGIYYSLATFAMAELLGILARGWRELTQGTVGITLPFRPALANMTFQDKTGYVVLALLYAIAAVMVCFSIYHSRYGFFLRAQRDDSNAARSIGVDAERMRLAAGIISAGLCAVGGTLYVQYLLFIDPDIAFTWTISVQAALITIIGGLGLPSGPVWGAMLLVPLERWLIATFGSSYGGLAAMIYGLALIAAVLLMPGGIVSLVSRMGLPRKWQPELPS